MPRGLRASSNDADAGQRSDPVEQAGSSQAETSEPAESAAAPSAESAAAPAESAESANPAESAESAPEDAESGPDAPPGTTTVSPPPPPSPQSPDPSAQGLRGRFRRRPGRDRPGLVRLPGTIFAAITLVPSVLVMAWLLAGLPLLLANRFSDIPMLIISVPLAIALVFVVVRELPSAWPHGIREFWDQRRDERDEEVTAPGNTSATEQAPTQELAATPPDRPKPDVPWWALIATLVVVAGFTIWQLAENSQQVIVLRDPATYLQFAYWIAHQGTTHIPQSLAAFDGSHPGMTFSSLGFFQSGTMVVPQFMAGLPMMLALGVWAGGPLTAIAMAPIIGGCAILAFAGLVGRLAGGRWAPAAALVLAVSLPQQYTSRTTFSETLAQVMLFGGLCMLADSFTLTSGRHSISRPAVTSWRDGPTPPTALAFFGGLAIGLTLLIRIDGASDLLPAIPFLGLLLVTRRPQAVPFGLGLGLGVAYGLADGFLLSRPYLDSLSGSLRPLAIIALAAIVLTGIGMALVNIRPFGRWIRLLLRSRPLRWLPEAGAALTVLVIIGFAVRPYFQTVRGETNPATISYVAELQKLAGLAIDGHRQYAEDSLYWVIWYLGVPAVILATLGLALLVRRGLKSLLTWQDSGAARIWALPLLITGWVVVSVLWRPGIIPDQPWASRRLVPMVLPGLILAATWMAAWLKDRGHRLGASRVA
ncbi:MAG TPA: hypothetical protein VGI00_18645, partial [Streptosporangiaceae bacterium]